jgi:hypothetical protein
MVKTSYFIRGEFKIETTKVGVFQPTYTYTKKVIRGVQLWCTPELDFAKKVEGCIRLVRGTDPYKREGRETVSLGELTEVVLWMGHFFLLDPGRRVYFLWDSQDSYQFIELIDTTKSDRRLWRRALYGETLTCKNGTKAVCVDDGGECGKAGFVYLLAGETRRSIRQFNRERDVEVIE